MRCEVHIPHPDTGEPVLVTREEIRKHAEADHRVLEAAERYAGRRARWHGRLVRALRQHGDDGTSLGDALRRAAADLVVVYRFDTRDWPHLRAFRYARLAPPRAPNSYGFGTLTEHPYGVEEYAQGGAVRAYSP